MNLAEIVTHLTLHNGSVTLVIRYNAQLYLIFTEYTNTQLSTV